MKNTLLLLPILMLSSAMPLQSVECSYSLGQKTDRDHAQQDVHKYCHSHVVAAYEEFCAKRGENKFDQTNMDNYFWTYPSYAQLNTQRCWNARNKLGIAEKNLAEHPRNCEYRFDSKNGIHCSSKEQVTVTVTKIVSR